MKQNKIIKDIAEAPAVIIDKTIEQTQKVTSDIEGQKIVKDAENYWKQLGPGLISGAADDDPSGVASYSQIGAKFGFQYLWLSFFSLPLVIAIQEMCARIGIVTGRGLASNIKIHFPKYVIYILSFLLLIANVFNIGADLGAMAKSTQLFVPNVSFFILLVIFTAISLGLQIYIPYARYAKFLKWISLSLFAYVITAFLVRIGLKEVAIHTFIPSMSFNKDVFILVCAFLGTTISPYLFFWQTSQEIEEKILKGGTTIKLRETEVSKSEIGRMRIDVTSGMIFSNLVSFFIIATCAATLWKGGITNIATASDAAQALRPLAGEGAYLLFALGIIGTGILGVPVLAGSAAYALSESFNFKYGLYRKLKGAYAFYGIIIFSMLIGFVMNLLGLDMIRTLIYAAVINGILAPIIMIFILLISGSEKIMGTYKNSPLITTVGWIATVLMSLVAIATIISII